MGWQIRIRGFLGQILTLISILRVYAKFSYGLPVLQNESANRIPFSPLKNMLDPDLSLKKWGNGAKKSVEVISSFFYGTLLFDRKNFCAGDFTTTVKAESIGQLLKTFQVHLCGENYLIYFKGFFCVGANQVVSVRRCSVSCRRILAEQVRSPLPFCHVMTKITFF